MHLLVVALVSAVLALAAYWFGKTYFKARISQRLMAAAVPYAKGGDDHRTTMLVLGDSTGVGVGADRPENTVAGRLAQYLGATYVENRAVIGAGVDDLEPQIKGAKLLRYDMILIQVGGNDILSFGNAKDSAERLGELLTLLPKSGEVVLLSAGNAGGAKLFPPFVRPFHTMTNLAFHREFEKLAKEQGFLYVNLYEPFYNDAFLRDPRRYLSRDSLHPSAYGYGLWFDKVKEALERKK